MVVPEVVFWKDLGRPGTSPELGLIRFPLLGLTQVLDQQFSSFMFLLYYSVKELGSPT